MARATVIPTVEALVAPATPVYQTKLSFDSPDQAYPGRAIHIVGQVTTVAGPDPATLFLRVLLAEDVVASFFTTVAFEQDVTIPGNVLLGQHVLTVELAPQGLYEGASASAPIEVVQASLSLKVSSPAITFLPRKVGISGEVTSALGPVRNAIVDLELGDARTTVRTDDQGRFSGSVGLSAGHLFLGRQTLHVTVQPAEPWHSAIAEQVTLFIINGANLAVLSMAAIYVALVLTMVWRRYRRRRSFAPAEGRTPSSPGTPSEPITDTLIPPTWAYIDPDSSRGRVVSAYHRAARLLESSQAVSFYPYFTLLDFLIAIGSRVSKAFVELTSVAERALYAARGTGEEEAQRAEGLARAVQEEGG